MNESAFFQDLAVMMVAASAVAVIFTRLKWPKVIGYLLAGVLMGKHSWGGSFLVDEASIATMGQLGIVFIMFTIGLSFSARDFAKTRAVTVPAALLDVIVMVWLGYTVGRTVFHWGVLPSVFLGAAICDSSTTLVAKVFDELGWSRRPFVKYVFGTAIFEDILCVGVIALVTGLATGGGTSLAAAGKSLGSLAVFFVCVLAFGLALVPGLLDRVGRLKSDEALLLTLLGCCFFVSYIAYRLDFSLALGAFLVGIMGSSSSVRDRLAHLAAPLRDMFLAVFFVTVGTLVDPAACWHHLPAILALAAVIVVGKALNCAVPALLAGQSPGAAVRIGMPLAQIGEFAYMVAIVYVTCTGDADSPMYQIVVGASMLTTCLNPLLIRASEPASEWVENHLPARVNGWISAYHDWLAKLRAAHPPAPLRKHLRTRVTWLAVIGTLNFAVAAMASALGRIDYTRFSTFFDSHKVTFFCLAANSFFLLMLAPLWRNAHALGRDFAAMIGGIAPRGRKVRAAVQGFTVFVTRMAVMVLAFAQVAMLNVNLAPPDTWTRLAILAVFALVVVFGWKHVRNAGRAAGRNLGEALAADNNATAERTLHVPSDFYTELSVAADSPAVGETLRSLDVRAKTGASVVAVQRGDERRRNPGPDWRFVAGDVVFAIGEPEQVAALRALFAASR